MEDLPIFQERLLLARRRAGVSQGELAKRTAMYGSDISKMERGRMLPTAPRLRRLAEALCVSADFLLGLQATADAPSRSRPQADADAALPVRAVALLEAATDVAKAEIRAGVPGEAVDAPPTRPRTRQAAPVA